VKAALQVTKWGRDQSHSCWKHVFSEWGRVQHDYWSNVPEDIGWWSSERANVSLLAHAVWRARGYSLQEYGDVKGSGTNQYRGRPDMYAYFLRSRHYMIEAKQCWPRLRGDWQAAIEASFDHAVHAAAENGAKHGCRVALTFASYVVPGNHIDAVDDLVAEVRRQPLRQHPRTKAGFRVDLFPHGKWNSARKGRFDVRRHTEWSAAGGKRYYVGVTLLAGFLD
jgi:hypothetical protein